jgi:hypothetical protein
MAVGRWLTVDGLNPHCQLSIFDYQLFITQTTMLPFPSQIPNLRTVAHPAPDYPVTVIEGNIDLPCWDGYALPHYPAYNPHGKGILLTIYNKVAGKLTVSQEHVAAYRYLLQHQEAVQQAILARLMDEYPDWQDETDSYTRATFMPDVHDTEQFKPLLQPVRIELLNVHDEGIAYVHFSFARAWEEDDWLGLVLHQNRVVACGGSEQLTAASMAEKDLRTRAVVKTKDVAASATPRPKPWWRFW